jgi:hypothetical protein
MKAPTLDKAAGVAVLVLGLCLPAGPVAAQAPDRKAVEQGFHVKHILRKYCLECHAQRGPGEAPKAGLRVLDRDLLVGARHVLIDLIQGGSMPPGDHRKVQPAELDSLRQWVVNGVPRLPPDCDREYVLWSIAQDLSKLDRETVPYVRYISFNHLRDEDGPSGGELAARQGELKELLNGLHNGPPLGELQNVDPYYRSVVRIDLRQLGWHVPPYPKVKSWNLYDLLLLEYRDAELPADSPLFAEIHDFLKQAAQVRPVPYLNGDWLIGALKSSPLQEDFRQTLKKNLARGLGGEGAGRQKSQLRLDRLWGLNFPGPWSMAPLDSLSCPNVPDSWLTFDLQAQVVLHADSNKPDPEGRESFHTEDEVRLRIKASQDALAEVFVRDDTGELFKRGLWPLKANVPLLLPEDEPLRLKAAENPKCDLQVIVFAYPLKHLPDGDKAAFPAGEILEEEGIHARILHPLYDLSRLEPDGERWRWKSPDPSRMVKQTFTFKVRPANK